jgi:hypothetical protein
MSNSNPAENAPPTEAEAAEAQAALIDLANSVALLPQVPPPEGEEERPEGAVALPVIEQDGNRYIPVFTTEDALVAAGGDPVTALRVPVIELAANWPADDLWLAVDPSTDQSLALPSELVRALPVVSGRNDTDGQSDQMVAEGGPE